MDQMPRFFYFSISEEIFCQPVFRFFSHIWIFSSGGLHQMIFSLLPLFHLDETQPQITLNLLQEATQLHLVKLLFRIGVISIGDSFLVKITRFIVPTMLEVTVPLIFKDLNCLQFFTCWLVIYLSFLKFTSHIPFCSHGDAASSA